MQKEEISNLIHNLHFWILHNTAKNGIIEANTKGKIFPSNSNCYLSFNHSQALSSEVVGDLQPFIWLVGLWVQVKLTDI